MFIACDEPNPDNTPEATTHQHSWSEWETVKDATCTEKGSERRKCDSCGQFETREVKENGHTNAAAVIESLILPTCTTDGSYDNVIYCSVCWEEVNRKANSIDKLGHDHSAEWTVDVEPDCTEPGSKSHHCSRCSDKADVTEIPANGHTFKPWKQTKAPTCTEKGSERRDCSVCGHEETREIKENGHTHAAAVVENRVEPTCFQNGSYDSVIYCSVCTTEISRDNLPLVTNGHSYNAVVTPPTNKAQGYTTHTCSGCGFWYVDTYVPATGSLGLAYTINADGTTCTIIGMGTCTDTELYINEKYDGYTVTSIGDSAFQGCRSLKMIVIPNSVTSIGKSAFNGCNNLTSIRLPFVGATKDGTENTHLGHLFGASSYSENKEYVPTSLRTVVITDGTRIGDYAFYFCLYLTNITIPDSVTSIGNYAFAECRFLTRIIIPDGVTSIGNSAFRFCLNLTSITIPDSVTSIGNSAFSYCNIKNITIPDGVTSISEKAFQGCSSLTSITIPDGVTSIGNYAFASCRSLTSISIPDSVTSIGSYAFQGCSSLTNITILSSVTSINSSTFWSCSSLESITIPNSVTSIGNQAFYDCISLTSITIPNSVTSIGNSVFSYCNIKSITIPDGVTSIGDYAFYFCSSLTSITIPNSVTSIGNKAFEYSVLTTVYYTGTADDWDKISIYVDNRSLTSATRYYYSKTQPTDETYQYWHYVDGVPTEW